MKLSIDAIVTCGAVAYTAVLCLLSIYLLRVALGFPKIPALLLSIVAAVLGYLATLYVAGRLRDMYERK